MSGFNNPVLGGGGALVRDSAHSPDYQPAVDGWSINQDGSAEFNDVTIRGDISLAPTYAPVTSIYDSSGGGAPPWNVTGSYVLFSSTAWGPVDMPAPASGRIRWDLSLLGMNNVSAASTLSVDLEVLESSSAGGSSFTPPGTQIHNPNVADAALIACQVLGSTSRPTAAAYHIIDGLTPGNWYRFRPYWRISSGAAANVAFPDLFQKFTISPIV